MTPLNIVALVMSVCALGIAVYSALLIWKIERIRRETEALRIRAHRLSPGILVIDERVPGSEMQSTRAHS